MIGLTKIMKAFLVGILLLFTILAIDYANDISKFWYLIPVICVFIIYKEWIKI